MVVKQRRLFSVFAASNKHSGEGNMQSANPVPTNPNKKQLVQCVKQPPNILRRKQLSDSSSNGNTASPKLSKYLKSSNKDQKMEVLILSQKDFADIPIEIIARGDEHAKILDQSGTHEASLKQIVIDESQIIPLRKMSPGYFGNPKPGNTPNTQPTEIVDLTDDSGTLSPVEVPAPTTGDDTANAIGINSLLDTSSDAISICRTCLEPVSSLSCVKLYPSETDPMNWYELRSMLSQICESIDLDASLNPVLCRPCVSVLKTSCAFRKQVGIVEEQIKANRKNANSAIDLKDMLSEAKPKQTDVLTNNKRDYQTPKQNEDFDEVDMYLEKRKQILNKYMTELNESLGPPIKRYTHNKAAPVKPQSVARQNVMDPTEVRFLERILDGTQQCVIEVVNEDELGGDAQETCLNDVGMSVSTDAGLVSVPDAPVVNDEKGDDSEATEVAVCPSSNTAKKRRRFRNMSCSDHSSDEPSKADDRDEASDEGEDSEDGARKQKEVLDYLYNTFTNRKRKPPVPRSYNIFDADHDKYFKRLDGGEAGCGMVRKWRRFANRQLGLGDPPYLCHSCGESFSKRNRFTEHVDEHKGIDMGICSYCGKSIKLGASMEEHVQLEHQPPSFECAECGVRFHLKIFLSTHMKTVHSKTWALCQCQICGIVLKQKSFKMHMKRHNDNTTRQCEVCKKVFYNSISYEFHWKNHFNAKKYQCQICSKVIKTQFHFKKHMEVQHGVVPEQISCKICGEIFRRNWSLVRHMRMEHGKETRLIKDRNKYERYPHNFVGKTEGEESCQSSETSEVKKLRIITETQDGVIYESIVDPSQLNEKVNDGDAEETLDNNNVEGVEFYYENEERLENEEDSQEMYGLNEGGPEGFYGEPTADEEYDVVNREGITEDTFDGMEDLFLS